MAEPRSEAAKTPGGKPPMLLRSISTSSQKNQVIPIVPETGFSAAYRAIYGPLNISLLVGPNGCGKTAAMSLVGRAFHYLERNRERAGEDFVLEYEIDVDGRSMPVRLHWADRVLSATVGDQPTKQVAEWTGGTRKRRLSAGQMTYDELRPALPKVVITAFSTRGEYPRRRPRTYVGDRLVDIFDLGNIYGRHHYGVGSLSSGIAKLAAMFLAHDPRVEPLRRLLGIEFTGRIRAHDPSISGKWEQMAWEMQGVDWDDLFSDSADPGGHEPAGWVPLTPELAERQRRGEVYFNDLDLRRGGRQLSLHTMSSGEKILFVRLLSLLATVSDNSLVLIEEPELHLDRAWTKQWITLLHSLFGGTKAHFVVSTHSFAFINAVFPENIVWFREGRAGMPAFNTFLSSEADLESKFFGTDARANTPEEFVSAAISRGDTHSLARLMATMGESHFRFQVFARLRK